MNGFPLTDAVTGSGDILTIPDAESWMQGRTLYGGASALLAYTAAIRAFPELPPFRAAQVGFVAPVGAEVTLRAEIVRQGRNVVQVRSDILCDGKVALTTFLLFGTARASNGEAPPAQVELAPGIPEDGAPVSTARAPAFLRNNFEMRYCQQRSNRGEARLRRWARLNPGNQLDPISQMILLGDILPPSAAKVMERPGPISSINWSFNLLDAEPATRDGWWLAETASDQSGNGYSSERLRLWNADGQQMLSGLQAVAIFG